ncbi:ABC transporter permease [Adhaeretor mobilis]|uniref:Macrolide export ATP-binding/permease protein MacB n=1 Tax=Adhaeretor mobilis TaxID=1930276 RepID=A0A517MTK7_9BACT|nr:FtsX-like permease family protein [Adhaeretor mobilis]QDS98219.1 Macrolide export ATP-binding/permease protein MacB [Adhaeretor mobilis]
MRIYDIVMREILERKSQMMMSFIAIFLGITAVVAIKNISYFSERAVERELDTLGANVLILPKAVTLQDYYSADLHDEVIPEEYVLRLTMSDIEGVDNLSPKLCVPVELSDRNFTLTGILPKSEFRAKSAWAGAGIFGRPLGCGVVEGLEEQPEDKQTLIRKRVIETLEADEVLLGAEVATATLISEGDSLELLGQPFKVIAVLPETGTVDDSRVFAHLHTVQELSGKGEVVNAIEVVGCCKQIAAGLVDGINTLLPDAKVVTVTQIAKAQVTINEMLRKVSLAFIGIIVVVGGASIANYMYSNVSERRREIGTMMALGATPSQVLRMLLIKAALLGIVGGLTGYAAGTLLAMKVGPHFAGVPVLPMPVLMGWALGLSLLIALAASYFPARRAANLDPCICLQEV